MQSNWCPAALGSSWRGPDVPRDLKVGPPVAPDELSSPADRLGQGPVAPAQYAALHSLLISQDSVSAFLQELADLAAAIAPGPFSCGITARYDGRPLTVSSSDAFARSLDETQYQAHEGPCLRAMDSGDVVAVDDVATEARWGHYTETARSLGLRSSLSVPLIVERRSVGAINLYSSAHAHAFDDTVRARAEIFAAQASTALLLATRQSTVTETNRQLEAALSSRSQIDQAMGIVMAQQRCSAERAFDLLRAHSQNTNRRLRDIARDLVQRTGSHQDREQDWPPDQD